MDSRALSGEAVFEEDMSDRPHLQERIISYKFTINGQKKMYDDDDIEDDDGNDS